MKKKFGFNEAHNDYMILIDVAGRTLLDVHNRDTKCSCGAKLRCTDMHINENGYDFWVKCPECHKTIFYCIGVDGVVYEKEYSCNPYDPNEDEV